MHLAAHQTRCQNIDRNMARREGATIMQDINKISSRRFTYQDVMSALSIKEYTELESVINEWIENEKIVPIKKSGKTSFIPCVYNEYKKMERIIDYSEYEKEIRTLHPDLAISRYLINPQKFRDNRKEILALSTYMWKDSNAFTRSMSVKERSYDIWKNEKFLESKSGNQICSWNHLGSKYLNYFYAPEPFFMIDLHENSEILTVLVIENKDTWYSLGKALKQSEKKTICNVKIDILIYGEGNKVTKQDAIEEFMEDFTTHPYSILYVGDIDVAGVNMLYNCRAKNSRVEVEPFVDLYKRMIAAAEPDKLKVTDDNRGLIYDESFLEYFSIEERSLIETVLKTNKRIPQEVLNYSNYQDMVN